MKPHNQVTLKLPFRKSFGIFSITRKRKIGFVFDNMVVHMVYINSGAKNGKEFEQWSKLENGALCNFEFIYCAACRYNMLNRNRKFTRVSLKRALMEATEEQVKQLADCLRRSEKYGATVKKKTRMKMTAKY